MGTLAGTFVDTMEGTLVGKGRKRWDSSSVHMGLVLEGTSLARKLVESMDRTFSKESRKEKR